MQFKLPLLLLATFFIDSIWTKDCNKLKSNTKLFCYYSDIQESQNFCQCTHIVLPEGTELKIVEKIRKQNGEVKILVTVSEFNEKLVSLLKSTKVDGVELNLRKIDSKNDLTDFISTVKSKLGSEHYIAVSVPSKTETLAKNFDFKELSKHADVFVLNTAFLGASQNVTFHPSRLSGLWDMQNTDSMVDLVSGLGAPLSKMVIAAPVQAFAFSLQNEEYTAPGSPATEVKSITRKELCDLMQQNGTEWTLERDQDQAGPYIFRGKQWIAFEDETSVDIKTKYARVRGLAGVALKDLSQDSETKCGSSILNAAFKGLSKQARAPRGAVLHTLEREILSPSSTHTASVHDSPFRISRIIDTEGKIHVVRQDTRTEFECSRQGYFVHPRSCNRFYRCVKFDQRTEEYNVFEFDCPAGLTFDEKTEVCVWPGSLPHASACSGSSEIAPVPQKRFSCPSEPGYYADPENCRWFFACLDHGEPSMQAYEFRCPFGLVFDEEKLLCEWPWMVPRCGQVASVSLKYYGGVSTNINQYDGLGVLQTVKLGGLQGPIQPAEAKIYSNVGFAGLSNKALDDGRIFSENSARFIDASRRLGLSLKATQSLYKSGLLSEKLAAIGLNQDDFGLQNLAVEVNSGLNHNSLGFGQQLNGFQQLEGQQNQAYQYSGQNLNVLSSDQQQGINGQLTFDSGAGITLQSSSLGANSGQYLGQSNIDQAKTLQVQGNTGAYNLYQLGSQEQNRQRQLHVDDSSSQVISGGNVQYQQTLQGNGFANLDQISQNNLALQQQNIDLNQYRQAQFGLGQFTSGNVGNNVQRLNQNSESNSYSTSYINHGQISQGQLGLQKQNVNLELNHHTQFEGNVQLTKENNGLSSSSYVNSGGLSQGTIVLGQSEKAGLGQYSTVNSGPNQGSIGEYELNIGGAVQNNQQQNDNLGTGYSSSYFNSGKSSEAQLNIQSQNIGSGQLDSKTQDIQSQNINQINVGLNAYRQNGGILLQNVEINGAAGSYTDDITQSNSNIALDSSDFSHVTPASVSHTTASSFESIVSATPLKTIDTYKQEQSGDTAGIEYSINNLQEPQQTIRFEENKGNQASSYQFIQKEQPSFVSSTPSSIILQQDTQKLSSIEFNNQPKLSVNGPQIQFVSSTSRPLTQELNIKTYTQQVPQVPVVSYSSVGEQGVLSGQKYSQDGGYSYEKPTTSFEEKPQVTVSSTPSYVSKNIAVTTSGATSYSYSNKASENVRYQENPQVLVQQPQTVVASQPSTGTSSSYFRQDANTVQYQTPQLVQQQPQVVSSYNYIKPEISQTLLVQQPQVISKQPATSYNYINQEKPQITVEQPQLTVKQTEISSGYHYVQPEVKKEVIVQQPQVLIKKPEAVVTSYNYVRPTVQSQIVYEQPKISVQQPVTVVENYNVAKPQIQQAKPVLSQSYSYTQQHARGSYKYEVPQVTVQEQPQVTTFQKPTVSTSFNTKTGYTYEKPSVVFQEEPKVVQPFVQQYIAQPVIQDKLLIQKQISQPVVQKQDVTSYQYFQPVVQQPRGFAKTSFQEEAVKTYSYSNPVRTQYIARPATITTTNYRAPVVKSEQIEFKGYGYPKPQVQFVEEPQPIITNYEGKVPVVEERIVPKKAYTLGNSFQYQTRIPTVQVLKEQPVYTTPRPTFISTVNSIVAQKASPEPQREYIYYDSRLDNTRQNQYFQASAVNTPSVPQNVEIKGYQYSKPTIKFEETPRPSQQQVYQYYQSNQVVKQRPIQVQPQVVTYTTPRPTFISTIKSIVNKNIESFEEQFITTPPAQIQYLESTTSRPVSTVTTSYLPAREQRIQNVEINGYVDQKPQVQSYQYTQQTAPQKQLVVEQYDKPTYYTSERPIEAQKLTPVAREYFYYDSRLTSTQAPDVKYIETSTRIPIVQKTQQVEFGGYDYPKPEVSFEEPKTVITSYENKVPVVEASTVPKKAYVTGEQSYTFNQNLNIEQQSVKPIVLENYVASNYQEHSSNSQLAQIDYVTPKPTYSSTIASVIAQKLTLVQQGFTYIDSRYSSTPRTRLIAQKVKASSARGYSYPKPQVQLLEEPQQVVNTVEIRKEAQPVVLENYVSPAYQKYDVSYQSTTPATILSQDIKEEVITYTRRPRPNLVKVTQAPVQLNLARGYSYPKPQKQLIEEPQQIVNTVEIKKEAQPIVSENYVSPAYQKYDVSYQSTTPATILRQNIKEEVITYNRRPRPNLVKVTQAPVELNLVVSTASPVLVQKLEQEQPREPFFYYDSRLSSTQGPQIEVEQEREEVPQVYRQEVTSYDSRYSTSARPAIEIKARPSVTIVEEKQPVQKIVTEEPYSLRVSTETPSSTYLPIRKRVRVTKPSRTYLPTSTTPSLEYLPSSTPVTVSKEYLPVSSTEGQSEGSISVENYQNFELVRKKNRPVKVVKIVRPRVKTVVVKKNDFNPFLSAKLGAQCTCTSNTIELRKEPLRIEVTDEDDDYENDDDILVEKKDGEAIVVESYESEKLDAVTDEPEVYIKSSTVEIPSSTYRVKNVNRGRARAQNVVVEDISSRRKSRINVKASDVNIVASRVRVKTPRVDIVSDDISEENVQTGRSRASLVEAKSGENVEINTRNFDRYGPGGLRSATETLQGIDCQRAGLFRHPTQCNKFYSCRWDCKKEKFTLHVFNCPVHLTFDNNLGACNWPSQGPACLENTLLPSE